MPGLDETSQVLFPPFSINPIAVIPVTGHFCPESLVFPPFLCHRPGFAFSNSEGFDYFITGHLLGQKKQITFRMRQSFYLLFAFLLLPSAFASSPFRFDMNMNRYHHQHHHPNRYHHHHHHHQYSNIPKGFMWMQMIDFFVGLQRNR